MDVLFMCVDKATLLDLCDLFPQTCENIKKRSLERRNKFMAQRNENSKAYDEKMKAQAFENESVQDRSAESIGDGNLEIKDFPFEDDEEPENFESHKEDMKIYLNKLNRRVDTLVDALKQAD